jgi:hypothetical protein
MTNKYQSGQEQYGKASEAYDRSDGQYGKASGQYDKSTDPVVDHPSYYNSDGIEVLDVITAFGFNFNTGNTLKYMARAGKKPGADRIVDLKKAAFYLNREIEDQEKKRGERQNE